LRSGVYLDNNAEPPFWMSPLNHRSGDNLIAFQNGLLDLSTGELEPHSPNFFNIYALPYEYTPNAREPKRFKQFLQELFPDDVEAERLLQEYIGLLLTPDTRFKKSF
jgi:putative DNA primase/helicase